MIRKKLLDILNKPGLIVLFTCLAAIFMQHQQARADGFIIPEQRRVIMPIHEIPNFSINSNFCGYYICMSTYNVS